ncbi:unnamed protein product [Caenorhabditis bovis]|uniref:DUF19 domain-containing protein n=1 Tax=Caenorhabditis bovis TaxID=2654633 RepID=A0A8S1EK31_9PELO|nr:unnamed protein product [Caenorhabditis bovis]
MRILAVFLAILQLTRADGEVSNCDYIGLVKCFITVLDDWAWTLYELRDNVVTIQPDQCEHLQTLDKCIKGEGAENHQCTHKEIIEVSNTVSDLLTHRKNSGSFLRSYYLLTYACSAEGQDILSRHRECLKTEKIGEMTLSAGNYLSEKFLEHSTDADVCDKVNEKLQEYIGAMSGLCSKHEAAQLMCQSLKNMFTGLHADKLDKCALDCKIPHDPAEEENAVPLQSELQDSQAIEQQQSEQDALKPADSTQILTLWIPIIIILFQRR